MLVEIRLLLLRLLNGTRLLKNHGRVKTAHVKLDKRQHQFDHQDPLLGMYESNIVNRRCSALIFDPRLVGTEPDLDVARLRTPMGS